MNLNNKLEILFKHFILNSVSNDLLKSIKESIEIKDIEILFQVIESIKDPSLYCENNYDNKKISGFFLFIDFITALIINLGDSAIQQAKNRNSKNPFVHWIIKYAEDERFHKEIMSKFSLIFED